MSIGSDAFEGCDSLTSVYYTGTTDEWVQISFGNDYSNPYILCKKIIHTITSCKQKQK